jgi:pimeloyl-ACP methyl ester carboxylesterase
MCGDPENTCSHFAEPITERGDHLLCPRGRLRCDGGGSTWPVHGITADVETAVQRALASLAGRVDERRGRTLIGYSLGAFRALTIAESACGRYPSVMLIGARIYPDPRLLRENGVTRLLLAAGDWDMMKLHMQRQAELLARADYPARFLGLGATGHAFNDSFGSYLSSALAWLQQHD